MWSGRRDANKLALCDFYDRLAAVEAGVEFMPVGVVGSPAPAKQNFAPLVEGGKSTGPPDPSPFNSTPTLASSSMRISRAGSLLGQLFLQAVRGVHGEFAHAGTQLPVKIEALGLGGLNIGGNPADEREGAVGFFQAEIFSALSRCDRLFHG